MTESHAVFAGLGDRLRQERRRLGLSQAEFAALAGVQRLAQGQYESEAREPKLSYLAALAAVGVDVGFVLFGRHSVGLPLPEQRRIEQDVFALIEEYVKAQCNGTLSAEARYVLFDVMRAHLIMSSRNGSETNIPELLSAAGGGVER